MVARLASIDRLRQRGNRATEPRSPQGLGGGFFSKPLPGGTNWTPAGPAPIVAGSVSASYPANSGRVLSLAIDPSLPSRIYVGTANAGIWRSLDGGDTWSARTDDQPSPAIGALAIDSNAPNRVFAGTGEYHAGYPTGGFAGQGLLYSSDFGDSWAPLAAGSFDGASITRILFDPGNTAQHMFLSCDVGVYESTTGGTSWTLMRAGAAGDLVLEVIGNSLRLMGAFHTEGLYQGIFTGGVWSPWSAVIDAFGTAFPTDVGRIALGQSRNHPKTIWAAFSNAVGSTLSGIAKTSNGINAIWSAVALPDPALGSIYGTDYNLYVAVHPDSPSTVYLGVNMLFRTLTGDAPWSVADSNSPKPLHPDHHAFAFDPTNPQDLLIGNDGGIYRSQDGGATWGHRNRGLGTVQLYAVANHPEWSAVMLVGTQDNGGAFATGAPAWPLRLWPLPQIFNSLGGDVVATAIDPLAPATMYYIDNNSVLRISTNGGRLWNKTYTFPVGSEWNLPFILDPAHSGVCYAGAGAPGGFGAPGIGTLLQSANFGSSFTPVSGPMTGNVTAVAIQPGNSDVLFVGTTHGHVYRVQRTGPDWGLVNVTTTELTGAPLPANMHISCLAIDTAGAAWLSFSSLADPQEPGVFTEDHVYCLPAGAATWQNRSTGLAQANPVNALAIDPTNDQLVFCGADTSVFRWDAASAAWELWDQGLPNTPIYQLAIHAPSRLLRAATYGRGVWERSIDPAVQPMVDIYMRDNILDDGHGPAPSGVPNPFAPATLVRWWMSPDIIVDAPPFQTPAVVTDDVMLANQVTHKNPVRNAINRFYVQVHNRGPLTATNVLVRAFFADASMSLPDLPADFWTAPKPFLADPSAVHWTPIGLAQSPGDLEPGHTGVVVWQWWVLQSSAKHSCLLALVTCDQDALSLPGQLNVANVVINHNNVAQKNLVVVP